MDERVYMSKILEFKGNWRTYQKRVLLHAQDYLKDGKIHIVAAPGSGKTTLGIELIGRIDKPSLILAPSITIREQWIERIKDGFLNEGINAQDYISNSLKNPAFITVATYQALHSAMTRFRGKLLQNFENTEDVDFSESARNLKDPENTEDVLGDTSFVEEVDYSDFELIQAMKSAGLEVICLDECHHLRSEWWRELENFKRSFETAKVISLTATPPYDSTPAMWKRYTDMCGEIDEEITIPELVKEESLCPHQDYVMFNYPTNEEKQSIEAFRLSSGKMLNHLMQSKEFEEVVKTHKGMFGEVSDDLLLENPAYLSAVLIYLQAKEISYPKRLLKLLGAKRLPEMDEKWMELLLQGILYDDTDNYICDKVFLEELTKELKNAGLLEKKKVCMTATKAVEKMLIQSKGKIESIKKIVSQESKNMGSDLRLLILTDFIRKECEKNLGNMEVEINQLGVLPFFEILRRECQNAKSGETKIRLGVLCGTMVIIPAESKEELIKITGKDKVSFMKAGNLDESDYLIVKAIGTAKFLTAAVTELFTKGYMQVLIGTKSLLGEGWDAPCVNSLILASFVGSFMLSNQMRGRAIRVDKDNPDKTSNIWHLVCINPPKAGKENETGEFSEDFLMLSRRMEHFLGLHYEEETIENGVARLSSVHIPFTKANVGKTNREMLELSGHRSELRNRWQNALSIFDEMEVAEEVDVSKHFITLVSFFDAMKEMAVAMAIMFIYIWLCVIGIVKLPTALNVIVNVGLICIILFFVGKGMMLTSPLKRLQLFGNGVKKAMYQKGLLSSEHSKVVIEKVGAFYQTAYLKGGTSKEKADFAHAVCQFFSEIDNQRYILVNRRRKNCLDGFFAVPEAFSKKKEEAQLFAECMKPFIGKYELIYTRNEEGRKLLLEGRLKAIGNREERFFKKKKVKSALE